MNKVYLHNTICLDSHQRSLRALHLVFLARHPQAGPRLFPLQVLARDGGRHFPSGGFKRKGKNR